MTNPKQSFGLNEKSSDKLCAVCDDFATGNHYSVPSCNGCKTFFRRAIVNKQSFVCEMQGNCPVNKGVRCSCRKCRLKKCLDVGMNPDSIQGSRDRIGYTKRSRKKALSAVQQAGPSSITANAEDEVFPILKTLSDENRCSTLSAQSSQSTTDPLLSVSSIEHISRSYKTLLDRLTNFENRIMFFLENDREIVGQHNLEEALQAPSILCGSNDIKTINQLSSFGVQASLASRRALAMTKDSKIESIQDDQHLRARVIVLYIEWAKTFTVFQKLPQSDKMVLIKNHASAYMIISQACRALFAANKDSVLESEFDKQRNVSVDASQKPQLCSKTKSAISPVDVADPVPQSQKPVQHTARESTSEQTLRNVSADLSIRYNIEKISLLSRYLEKCIMENYVAKPFEIIEMSLTEIAALQAIMFFDPSAEGLDSTSQRNIASEQRKYIDALYYYISRKDIPKNEVDKRYATIVMRTSVIKRAALKNRDTLDLIDIFYRSVMNIVKETVISPLPLPDLCDTTSSLPKCAYDEKDVD